MISPYTTFDNSSARVKLMGQPSVLSKAVIRR